MPSDNKVGVPTGRLELLRVAHGMGLSSGSGFRRLAGLPMSSRDGCIIQRSVKGVSIKSSQMSLFLTITTRHSGIS